MLYPFDITMKSAFSDEFLLNPISINYFAKSALIYGVIGLPAAYSVSASPSFFTFSP